jgi:hypothetical protein
MRITKEAEQKTSGVKHPRTRFNDFDEAKHPFNKWWRKHGRFMMSGGGRREMIWAARGWIAREQLGEGVQVTGETENKR